MPIYEYRCKDCQQVFEEWCKNFENGDAERTCPVCKGPAGRIISNTSFALKGGGWYVTEYGSHKGKETGAGAKATGQPVAASSNAEASCSSKANCSASDSCDSSAECAAPSAS